MPSSTTPSSSSPSASAATIPSSQPAPVRPNMLGSYGPWMAAMLGEGPARMSFRTGKWESVDAWRSAARKRVLECIAPVDFGRNPVARIDWQGEYDGLHVERLSWQLPCGPRTEAVFLKPAKASGPLPGIVALHDHGGNKYLGWRKIARIDDQRTPIIASHQDGYYGGRAWANEIARRGYAVLVPDTFAFGSRRVKVAEVPPKIRFDGVDPESDDPEEVLKYNRFAREQGHIMAKSLFAAGTSWPGVFTVEDMRSVDVLCNRPDVNVDRIGCAGLSGGGLRSCFLGGLDDRIKCAIPIGFTTTWREFVLDKSFTHTWMAFVPLLPRDLDFPEILALRAPAATMVLNCREDGIYTLPEMERAHAMIRDTFALAGASAQFQDKFYPGGHKFDVEMQADAFAWFDRHLKGQR